MKTKIIGFFVVFVLSLGLVRPLFTRGYFPMHDDTQIGRVVSMGKALRWGQFPVRWVSDLGYGYGYPLFNFYGPLPYYAGGFLYALGVSGITATKITMGIGMIGAGLTMFLVLASYISTSAAVTAAVLYMYAPYHAVQLYVRGAVGELWTLVFFPLLLWAYMGVNDKPARRWAAVLAGGVGLAGIILSHTLLGYATAALLGFILALLTIYSWTTKRSFIAGIHLAKILGIGLSLSAFFWLPALLEMRYTNVAGQVSATADFHDHFVCFSQLWNSLWGFGGSTKGCIDGISFILGKVHIFVGLLSLIFIVFRKKFDTNRQLLRIGALSALIGIFLVTSPSVFVWDVVPYFSYIQYPWRFLVYAIFGLSILGGVLIQAIRGRMFRWVCMAVLCSTSVLLYGKWFSVQYLYERPASEFESEEMLRFDVSNISYEYLPTDFIRPTNKSEYARETIIEKEGIIVDRVVQTDTYERFTIITREDTAITLKKAHFPGWRYWVNGKEQTPIIDHALPTIVVPKGENVVEVRFTNTPIRRLGNIISLIAIIGLGILYGKKLGKTNT